MESNEGSFRGSGGVLDWGGFNRSALVRRFGGFGAKSFKL